MERANRGYERVVDGDLTYGLFFPITTASDPVPAMENQHELAQFAENLGFDALWVRDVPLFWPQFRDAGQVYDPWVYLAHVAAHTEDVALATGSIVLPLRHPIHVAKAAASIDRLADGRLVLGIGSGDRPPEFTAFGIDEDQQGERFREAVSVLRRLWSEEFPVIESSFGRLDGSLDLLPKPDTGTLPLLVTGNAGQSIDWIGDNADGWLHYQLPLATLEGMLEDWRAAGGQKPFAMAMGVALDPDPSADMDHVHQGYDAGSEWFVDHIRAVAELGVDHLAIGLRGDDRDARATLERFADEVMARV